MFAASKRIRTKKIGQIVSWTITVIIGLAILGVAFVKLVPGYGMYIVRSDSMKPGISAGDIIITGPVHEIQPGEIITFDNQGKIVTHRAVSIENGQITTKGDANKSADSGTTAISSVQGSYLFKVPAIGWITNLTNSKKGWFLIVIIPTLILVGFLIKDILKEAFKDDKKKSAAGISPVMQTVAVGADSGVMNKRQSKPVSPEPVTPAVKKAAQPEVIKPVVAEVKAAKAAKEVPAQVFSNKQVNDNIRNEMRKILADLS